MHKVKFILYFKFENICSYDDPGRNVSTNLYTAGLDVNNERPLWFMSTQNIV